MMNNSSKEEDQDKNTTSSSPAPPPTIDSRFNQTLRNVQGYCVLSLFSLDPSISLIQNPRFTTLQFPFLNFHFDLLYVCLDLIPQSRICSENSNGFIDINGVYGYITMQFFRLDVMHYVLIDLHQA